MTVRGSVGELAAGRIGPLLLKFSWPALVAMALNALYAVVDRFYIGRCCGEAAMAGLTLVMPVMMLFGAFGVFVGAGHSAVLSIKLGEGDRVACEKLLGELVAVKLLLFLALPPLVFFNADAVLSWSGGRGVSAEAFAAGRSYLRTVVFSHLFSHLAFGLSAMTRAEGGAVKSMMSMVVGFGTNLALDPLFIFGFGMGVEGAAWATNVAMSASFLWALRYYLGGRTAVRLRWRRIALYRAFLWRTSAIGFAPFLQQLLGAAVNVSLAAAFAKWAADEDAATAQLASLGVYQSVMILTIMPVMGAQQGLQPIFGYNWGARNFRRVRSALALGFWITTALCVAACAVQTVPPFPRWLSAVFVPSGNPALLAAAAHDLAVANCMIWCIGVNVVATTYFQSIGRPAAAVALSTLRQGVVLIPCIWLLPRFMADRTLAVWLALPISDVLCQLATVPPILLHARFLARVRPRRPADDDPGPGAPGPRKIWYNTPVHPKRRKDGRILRGNG
ncbi:MAG: MATE family efflux transporter [Kiritimatiellae bacterium]|nr:MATE family efflux transporter [Kiritimatiellia bacterium]